MTRKVLYSIWRGVVLLAIGMMLCGALMGAWWLVYQLAYQIWGPG